MMSAMSGMRRPNLSPRMPKMNAPTGRIISVTVIANATLGMVCPKSWPIGTRTNVTRKKSSASSAQPRKQATKVFRCSRLSDLKSRTASTPSQLNVMLREVETSLKEEEPRIARMPQMLNINEHELIAAVAGVADAGLRFRDHRSRLQLAVTQSHDVNAV